MAEANQTVLKVLNDLKAKIGTGGVFDSWSDGNGNFWRKYADGWIEQRGKIPNGNAWTWYTATLNTPFTSTFYTLVVEYLLPTVLQLLINRQMVIFFVPKVLILFVIGNLMT